MDITDKINQYLIEGVKLDMGDAFKGWKTSKEFPVNSCLIRDKDDPDMVNSDKPYYCAVEGSTDGVTIL